MVPCMSTLEGILLYLKKTNSSKQKLMMIAPRRWGWNGCKMGILFHWICIAKMRCGNGIIEELYKLIVGDMFQPARKIVRKGEDWRCSPIWFHSSLCHGDITRYLHEEHSTQYPIWTSGTHPNMQTTCFLGFTFKWGTQHPIWTSGTHPNMQTTCFLGITIECWEFMISHTRKLSNVVLCLVAASVVSVLGKGLMGGWVQAITWVLETNQTTATHSYLHLSSESLSLILPTLHLQHSPSVSTSHHRLIPPLLLLSSGSRRGWLLYSLSPPQQCIPPLSLY